jgi:hypothetical protein
MKKYNIVLIPNFKKTWVHYDLEIYVEGNDKSIGHQYSTSTYGEGDYPAFRPDWENDVADSINERNIDLSMLRRRCYSLYLTEKVENLWDNIVSVKVRNPVYYCLNSKIAWQDKKNHDVYSDKFIEVKNINIYDQKQEDTIVAECQIQRLEHYYESGGSFVEVKRKHIRQYKRLDEKLMQENLTSKQYQSGCLSIFYGIINDVKEYSRI